jgi:hypothetical protein
VQVGRLPAAIHDGSGEAVDQFGEPVPRICGVGPAKTGIISHIYSAQGKLLKSLGPASRA